MATSHTLETRTTLDNLMKYVYGPGIIEATPKQVKLLKLLQTRLGKVNWGGKSFTIPVELNYMGSFGSRPESGYLPDSTPGNWVNTVVPITYQYFSVAVTGPAMATSSDQTMAFAEAWARQVSIKQRAYAQHMNRIFNGDGNGYLAQVDGTPSSSGSDYTVTLDNAYGISGYNSSNVNGARFISTNMKVDFYSGSSLRDVGACKITSWTKGAFPSTSATAVFASGDLDSVADGDYMFVAGSKGYEAAGIKLLIDDNTVASTVQSLSATTYAEWRAQMAYGSTPGTAEALTRMRMTEWQSNIEEYGGGNIDFFYTSPGVWATLGDTVASENQITNAKVMDNGFTAVEFNGIPIYKDPYCVDEIFAVDTGTLAFYEAKPEGWLDFGGQAIHMSYDRKDEYEAYWGWYVNLGVDNRAKNGKMVDITVRANQY